MMEFALSKFNLLIFVTAIAAIVLFFMNTVTSNLTTRQGFELVYKTGKELKSGIDSESYCTIKYIDIPTKLRTNESSSSVYSIPYILNLSTYVIPNPNQVPGALTNKLVLAIMDRKKTRIIAAYDVDYNGTMYFANAFLPDNSNGPRYYEDMSNWKSGETDMPNLDLNPNRVTSIDTTILFIKKVVNTKNYYFIMPCSKRNGLRTCKDFVQERLYNGNDPLNPDVRVNCIEITDDLTTI